MSHLNNSESMSPFTFIIQTNIFRIVILSIGQIKQLYVTDMQLIGITFIQQCIKAQNLSLAVISKPPNLPLLQIKFMNLTKNENF